MALTSSEPAKSKPAISHHCHVTRDTSHQSILRARKLAAPANPHDFAATVVHDISDRKPRHIGLRNPEYAGRHVDGSEPSVSMFLGPQKSPA